MATTTFEEYNAPATYTFSFASIQESDIKVSVDGTVKTSGSHYNITGYSTTGGGTVVFTSGNVPSNGALINIFRDTNVDSAKATFAAGSSVKAADLNANHQQLLFAAQEEQNQLEQTSNIRDNAITTAKIADNAVTMAKLNSGTLPTDITVASANLVDGTIVNADVSASAAIAGTKIDPNFGTQVISTTGNISVGGTVDGRDVAADGTKLDTIETNAKDDQTAAEIKTLYESNSDTNAFQDAEKTKLAGIETAATADQTAAEIRQLVGLASDSNVFTDADHSKLDGIEAGATADQTAAEIKSLYESVSDTNEFSDAEKTKLGGIEAGATADQTNAEIKTAYEANANTNEFSDAEQTKLAGIETGATADQTNAEIKTAYETNADTNEFSDAEQSKLAGIETAATADQTASEIKTLLQSDKLTLAEMNTTSLDSRYFTETEADNRYFRQDSSETIDSGDTWSSSDAFIATTGAINARIVDLIDDVGGFTAITSEQHFPNTNPQGSTGQSAILSIQAASTTLTPSGTTVTVSNGNLANNANITITGVSAAIPTGFGFLVESTSTLHTYTFHRLVPKATEVTTVANNITNIVAAGANVADINNFADLYQISGSAPTQRADGSSLAEGDLWFDSSNDNIQVYDGSAFSAVTPSQSVLADIAIVSGAITYSEDLGLITNAVSTGSSNGSLDIVADVLEDEITFTVTAATGKFIIDGVDKPALTLYKGWTYTFDVSDASNASHPLRFSSGGSAYNTGVTVTGTQGQAGAKVQLVVPESQPASFIYYCTNHSGMGNSITVKDDPLKTVSDNITDITAVANNSTNINAVASNASNINSAVSNASNINSAVSNASNINAAVSNASNITAVAGNNSNITAVADNETNINAVQSNASNINAVAGNATNINAVAADATDIGAVAGKATEIGRLGTAAAVADLAILGTTAIVSDMDTLADISSNITSVANNASNINSAVSNASNINSAVSNASNINTVAGNNTNINTVAGISGNVTTVANNSSNVTTVAGISSNVTSVAGNATNINSVVSNASNINTVAGSISNVNNVGNDITNVNTVASNISNVSNFANRYRIASSAPTSGLDQGDLYFDTTSNELRVYNGSAWQGGVTATGNLPSNGANTFTGDQTVQANIIVTGTVDGRDVATDGSKLDGIESGATADQTAAEIRTLVESASDSNVFTDADHSKLNGIEASATADQTAAEIRSLVESASNSNVFTDADHSKLNGIEASATADQTASEIVALISGQTIAPNVITTTNLTIDFGSIA